MTSIIVKQQLDNQLAIPPLKELLSKIAIQLTAYVLATEFEGRTVTLSYGPQFFHFN